MSKFRKKPVIVEAIHYTWDDDLVFMEEAQDRVADFMGSNIEVCADSIFIPTLEGEMEARPGDWIIKGVQGEFYPCKPDIFAATYEAVED